MNKAAEEFNKGNIEEAINIYTSILEEGKQHKDEARLNRASAFYTSQKYDSAINDCVIYVKQNQKPCPEIYVIYINSLIKTENYKESVVISEQAGKLYPFHKKLKSMEKLAKQKAIASDEELYIESMFEKLCAHPKVREYLKDQSFLTKVERMIRNPSLTSALAKMDPRIDEASEALMMAEQSGI